MKKLPAFEIDALSRSPDGKPHKAEVYVVKHSVLPDQLHVKLNNWGSEILVINVDDVFIDTIIA